MKQHIVRGGLGFFVFYGNQCRFKCLCRRFVNVFRIIANSQDYIIYITLMLYVVSDEMIPMTHKENSSSGVTYALLAGFCVMLISDVLLG